MQCFRQGSVARTSLPSVRDPWDLLPQRHPFTAVSWRLLCLRPVSESSVTHTEAQQGSPVFMSPACHRGHSGFVTRMSNSCVVEAFRASRPEASGLGRRQSRPTGLIVIQDQN